MAERRMFSKSVVDSDLFLDMPLTSQALYFHLAMRADDDGFVNNPRKIQRMIGCSTDDLTLLSVKGFTIPFDSGILVITHWKQHNYIPKDRYKPTVYLEEKGAVSLHEGVYTLNVSTPTTERIQNGDKTETQDRLGKDRLGKDRLNTICAEPEKSGSTPMVISLQLNTGEEYFVSQADVEKWSGLFPAVDVMQQLRSMKAWCEANPAKRKTQRGIKRFITSWLTREQDRGGNVGFGKGGNVCDKNGRFDAGNSAANFEQHNGTTL